MRVVALIVILVLLMFLAYIPYMIVTKANWTFSYKDQSHDMICEMVKPEYLVENKC